MGDKNNERVTGGKYLDTVFEYVDTHKRDAFTKLIFGVLIIFLGVAYVNLKNNMVMSMEVPPVLRESGKLMVGYNKGNDLFYKVWGQYFVDEYTSLSPDTSKKKLNHLLTMVDSKKAVVYSPKFQKKMDYIRANKIKQTYIPTTEVLLPQAQNGLRIFQSEGILQEKIDRVVIRKNCKYNFGLKIANYRLLIGLINEKCEKIGEVK